MPTDQPSNAPAAIGADARDRDTAAGVLQDAAPELNPGGGGIVGAAVPPPLEVEGGGPRGPTGNSPIDPGLPPTDAGGETPADAAAEARALAARTGAPEPRLSSQ